MKCLSESFVADRKINDEMVQEVLVLKEILRFSLRNLIDRLEKL